MADKKINALTAATTPLAGTEVLPVVQGGSTVKVAVSDLTAGRAVSAASFTASTGNFVIGTTAKGITTGSAIPLGLGVNNTVVAITIDTVGNVGVGTSTPPTKFAVSSGVYNFEVDPQPSTIFVTAYDRVGSAWHPMTFRALDIIFSPQGVEQMRISSAGNITATTGNLVIGTAGKGIDFSANSGAAGMTSELLTWYEEGVWTPNQGAGLTVVGAFSSSGKYTRIGRQVTVTGQVNGATSVLVSASGVISTNLPFTSGVNTLGIATNSALSVVGGVFVSSGTTNLSATVAIGATSTIYFQVTYFV